MSGPAQKELDTKAREWAKAKVPLANLFETLMKTYDAGVCIGFRANRGWSALYKEDAGRVLDTYADTTRHSFRLYGIKSDEVLRVVEQIMRVLNNSYKTGHQMEWRDGYRAVFVATAINYNNYTVSQPKGRGMEEGALGRGVLELQIGVMEQKTGPVPKRVK